MDEPIVDLSRLVMAMLAALPLAMLSGFIIQRYGFRIEKRYWIAVGVSLLALAPASWVLQSLPLKFNFHFAKTKASNTVNSRSSNGNHFSIRPWKTGAIFLDFPSSWGQAEQVVDFLEAALKKYGVAMEFVYLEKGHALNKPVDVIWNLKFETSSKVALPFQSHKEVSWSVTCKEIHDMISRPNHVKSDRATLKLDGYGKINIQVNGLFSKYELAQVHLKHAMKEVGKSMAEQLLGKYEVELYQESVAREPLPEVKDLAQPAFVPLETMPRDLEIERWIKHPGFLYGDLHVLWGSWEKASHQNIVDFVQSILDSERWAFKKAKKEKVLENLLEKGPNSLRWEYLSSTSDRVGWLSISLIEKEKKSFFSFGADKKKEDQDYDVMIYWTEGRAFEQRTEEYEIALLSDRVYQDVWEAYNVIYTYPLYAFSQDNREGMRALKKEWLPKWKALCEYWIKKRPLDFRLVKHLIYNANLSREEKLEQYDGIIERLKRHAKFYGHLLELQHSRKELVEKE